MPRRLLAVLALLVGCVDPAAAASARRANVEAVRFTFAWPAGQSARVVARKSVRTGLETTTPPAVEFRLRATPIEDGHLRVAGGDYELLLPSATEGGPPQREPLPFTLARAASIPFIVDPSGRFLRIADVESAKAAMTQAMKEIRPGTDAALVGIAGAPGGAIEVGLREAWDPIVGLWAGREFELDREYEVDATLPLPIGDTGGIAAQGRIYVHRAPDCERGGVARRCVYVEYTVRAEHGAIEAAARRAAASIGGGAGAAAPTAAASAPAPGPSTPAMSIVVTSTLLVEPDTLVPHEYDCERAIRFTPAPGASGVEASVIDTERREYTFAAK